MTKFNYPTWRTDAAGLSSKLLVAKQSEEGVLNAQQMIGVKLSDYRFKREQWRRMEKYINGQKRYIDANGKDVTAKIEAEIVEAKKIISQARKRLWDAITKFKVDVGNIKEKVDDMKLIQSEFSMAKESGQIKDWSELAEATKEAEEIVEQMSSEQERKAEEETSEKDQDEEIRTEESDKEKEEKKSEKEENKKQSEAEEKSKEERDELDKDKEPEKSKSANSEQFEKIKGVLETVGSLEDLKGMGLIEETREQDTHKVEYSLKEGAQVEISGVQRSHIKSAVENDNSILGDYCKEFLDGYDKLSNEDVMNIMLGRYSEVVSGIKKSKAIEKLERDSKSQTSQESSQNKEASSETKENENLEEKEINSKTIEKITTEEFAKDVFSNAQVLQDYVNEKAKGMTPEEKTQFYEKCIRKMQGMTDKIREHSAEQEQSQTNELSSQNEEQLQEQLAPLGLKRGN